VASSGWEKPASHRASLIAKLASLDPPPESVPINNLVPIPGTPLASSEANGHFRVRPHDCRRPHHHAAQLCPAIGRSGTDELKLNRPCAFWPGPTRFSTAITC
jgi:hypothetical protein